MSYLLKAAVTPTLKALFHVCFMKTGPEKIYALKISDPKRSIASKNLIM